MNNFHIEIEDQFLRLQEILNCKVYIDNVSFLGQKYGNIYEIDIKYDGQVYTKEQYDIIHEEILRIRRFLQGKFPINMEIGEKYIWNPIIISTTKKYMDGEFLD